MRMDAVSQLCGGAGSYASTSTASTNPKGELGKDAFLELLVAQLKHQNPLEPMSDTEFIGQMAQFTQIEELQNLRSTLEIAQAGSLLGRTVTALDSSGETVRGTVKAIRCEEGEAVLVLDSLEVKLSDVTEVSLD